MKNESKKQLLLLFFSVLSLISSQVISNRFESRGIAIEYKILNQADSLPDFKRDDIIVDTTKRYCTVCFSNFLENSITNENIPITLYPTTIKVDTAYFESTSREFVDSSSLGHYNNIVRCHIGELNKISPIEILISVDINIDSVRAHPNISNCSVFENGNVIYQPLAVKVIVWFFRIIAVILFIWVGYAFLKKKYSRRNEDEKEPDNNDVQPELQIPEATKEEPELQKGLRRYLSGWRDGSRNI